MTLLMTLHHTHDYKVTKLQRKDNKITTIPQFLRRSHPPRKIEPPLWQSASKKYKATRMSIWQHSPKKFQTSSAMKFATFHIKHV